MARVWWNKEGMALSSHGGRSSFLREHLARPLTSRGLAWRLVVVAAIFFLSLLAFASGVGVDARPGVETAGLLTQAYYALGLFVLGGLDLGVPTGGPQLARGVLWFAYFAAPAVTTTALVEGLHRAVRPDVWRWRRARGHVVVFGYGRVGALYISRLRAVDRRVSVVVVDRREDLPRFAELRAMPGVHLVQGDARDPRVLARVGAVGAARILMLTSDDFANLEAATRLLELDGAVASRVVVHLGDLGLRQSVARTRVGRECAVFNEHEAAAHHLVETRLRPRFESTEARDTVVLAGFGRFGQAVLDQLQQHAAPCIEAVVLVDLQASEKVADFAIRVGFHEGHQRFVVDGNLGDARVWARVEEVMCADDRPVVLVVASGDDGLNLRQALSLQSRHQDDGAFVVVRTFHRSRFAAEVAGERGVVAFSVADLLAQAMPTGWFTHPS